MTTNVATSHENGDDRLSLIRARLYLLDRWVRGRLITTSGGWMCWTRREAVPCDPSGATVGRHAVTAALTETLHPVGSEDRAADHALVYEAGVVASELLSNAARACRSRIAPRLDVHHGGIRIEVYDDGPGVPSSVNRAHTRSAAADCASSTRSRRRGAQSRDRRASASGPRCRSSARPPRTWTAPTAVADVLAAGSRAQGAEASATGQPRDHAVQELNPNSDAGSAGRCSPAGPSNGP